MSSETEIVVCAKPEVFVFALPPLKTSKGYKASEWNLAKPEWIGSLKVITKGKLCWIKLYDTVTNQLYASIPVTSYPGSSFEPVIDSSRYFVVKIVDDSGRHAYVGMGFRQRNDSFDVNVALQDHFTRDERMENLKKEFENQPKLDLKLREGQKISFKVDPNFAAKKKTTTTNPQRNPAVRLANPPANTVQISLSGYTSKSSQVQPEKNYFNENTDNSGENKLEDIFSLVNTSEGVSSIDNKNDYDPFQSSHKSPEFEFFQQSVSPTYQLQDSDDFFQKSPVSPIQGSTGNMSFLQQSTMPSTQGSSGNTNFFQQSTMPSTQGSSGNTNFFQQSTMPSTQGSSVNTNFFQQPAMGSSQGSSVNTNVFQKQPIFNNQKQTGNSDLYKKLQGHNDPLFKDLLESEGIFFQQPVKSNDSLQQYSTGYSQEQNNFFGTSQKVNSNDDFANFSSFTQTNNTSGQFNSGNSTGKDLFDPFA